ncbi:MAG: UvrB/UvrC motif-containing protein [candidate division Zixibacteria bacterium]|nr:UvrB/UvrC motif-containing protein [candidate division Zixibacteria bacterium]
MLCQDCKKREAQVHLTQVVNNEKMSLSLCKECAAARGFHSPLDNMPFPLAEILSGLAAELPGIDGMTSAEDLTCPECGLTFDKFTRQGRFGCGQCYNTFRNRLEPIMRKIQGASLHRGKTPQTTVTEDSGVSSAIKEEERLEQELKKAIEAEDFERAAEIRDKLKSLKENQSDNKVEVDK